MATPSADPDTDPDTETRRRAEIAASLSNLERRVADACDKAGRPRSDVTLVAVTKTFPWTDVVHCAALGLRDMGESRDQDAAPKVARCIAYGLTDLRWHFVGQLQTNKVAHVAGYADVVHSVDRARLVDALERAAAGHGRELLCLVQVDLDKPNADGTDADKPDADKPDADKPDAADAGRGGVAPAALARLAARIDASEHLRLGGVMAVAPRVGDATSAYTRLAEVSGDLRSTYPQAVMISAGMSGDLEAAVATGATHLRVGTALLGSRPPLR